MPLFTRLLCLAGFLTLASCATTSRTPPPALPLSAFGFTLENRPAADQVALLQRLGYDGMMVSTWGPDPVAKLREFTRVPAVAEGRFRVRALLWTPKAEKNPKLGPLDQFLPLARQLQASLWVAPTGTRADLPEAITLLRQTAERCRQAGVELVLYPHFGHPFEDGFQALEVWEKLGCPEVRLSLHICHELKAGNLGRWDELVRKSAPHLAFVTVSGAETRDVTRDHDWTRAILPLDRGDLDLRPFVDSLRKHHFQGAVFLHTFGLKDPPEEHFARSMAAWKTL